MAVRTFAHLSDLHLGLSADAEAAARELCDTLRACGIDHVIVTGDITHKGRHDQLRRFAAAFAPLLEFGRMTLVPGNHDRIGEDAGALLMEGDRVRVTTPPGLYVVQIDSTAEHNRSFFAPHGALTDDVLQDVDVALAARPRDRLCVIALHHHPIAMPEETFGERIASGLGWPHGRELPSGEALVALARQRADLILHGHRHVPREVHLNGGRTLSIYNGGASTLLRRFRVFHHVDGRTFGAPQWMRVANSRGDRPRRGVLDELRAVFA